MGWVESPKFFCTFLETLTDVPNVLIHTLVPVPGYGAISKIPETGQGPPHTLDILTHIDCYMDDVIISVQVGPEWQRQVFDSTVWTLNWLFLSLPGETKDSVRENNLWSGEGNWTCVKEVLGWMIDIEAGTVSLPEKNSKS